VANATGTAPKALKVLTPSSAHAVHQQSYTSSDCSGTHTDYNFWGENECFTTDTGESEKILCDADNAAMHVTLYSDQHCTTYRNAFSIKSGDCHPDQGSFSWSCYWGTNKVAKATGTALEALKMHTASSGHAVHQQSYASSDCSGAHTDYNFWGENECFATNDGESEKILCDADNAAMHVTLYSDQHCTTYRNAFSIKSGDCHQDQGSFSWSCYWGTKKVAKATGTAPEAFNLHTASSGHAVHQQVYTSSDCSGAHTDQDFGGENECFETENGRSEKILCDADDAAMHVTLYSDDHCGTYLNAFSTRSGQCNPEWGGSFTWSCSSGMKKVANATGIVPGIVV